MNAPRATGAAFKTWRVLMEAQLRENPMRLVVTLCAIGLGVALGTAVYLVNANALNEFGLAANKLVGKADLVIRGPRAGFAESLYVKLARDPDLSAVSPVLQLEAAIPGQREPLEVLGVDPFRALALQPALIGDIAGRILELFRTNGILLSASAARRLHLRAGDELKVVVGDASKSLPVLGVLSEVSYPQPLGLMDIASAQWLFGVAGRLNRIDLRLAPGTSVESYRERVARELPPGVMAIAPQIERDRAATVTRAYRVNLNMLALVALWTGAFLVFATQSLSVLRRRRSLALLRALGITRGELRRALVGEGAALGALGSLLGISLGVAAAAAVLHVLAGDLGNGQLRITETGVHAPPLPLLCFFLIGTAVASAGAWMPACSAAREQPARGLKGGDADYAATTTAGWRLGVCLLLVGAVLARLPSIAGLPLFGYGAVAALLFGGVFLVPTLTVKLFGFFPRTQRVVWDAALAQLRANVGMSTLSLASVIVSFSLMVAMAIMVFSFRVSFENWLVKLLPADIQVREPLGNDTAFWSPATQARMAAVPGIARFEFRHTQPVFLDAGRPAVTLIVRGATAQDAAGEMPLIQVAPVTTGDTRESAWISEALQDLYGLRLGGTVTLVLGGRSHEFRIAGVWRDYARVFGAIVIAWPSYIAATGDLTATEGSAWLTGTVPAVTVQAALRAALGAHATPEILSSTEVRDRSLQIFDRAFAITYALEAIAVLIGLMGVSFAASSTALARRAEFGMLRHIGMLRRQVIGLLASEGLLMSAFGVLYGLILGGVLSLVLVYVVNRQSFNWSIDWALPLWQLVVLSLVLVGAAALTAVWSGRAATSKDAVRAVREDW